MKEQEKQRILILHQSGCSDADIANITGYARGHISYILRSMGIRRTKGKTCSIPEKTIEKICALRELGLSYRKIGEQTGINWNTVYDCVKREKKHGRFKERESTERA